jgi:WD40 repeat protein
MKQSSIGIIQKLTKYRKIRLMHALSLAMLSLMGALMIGCTRSDDLLRQQVVAPSLYPKTQAFQSYAKEFPGPFERPRHDLTQTTNSLRGILVSFDSDQDSGMCVATTIKDARGEPIGELHLWNSQTQSWTSYDTPPNLILIHPQLVKQQHRMKIMLETIEPGKGGTTRRVSLYDPPTKKMDLLHSGMAVEVSPDRKSALFISSEDGAYHFLYLFDVEQEKLVQLFTFATDSDSGPALNYRWSEDSKAVLLSGQVVNTDAKVRLIYVVAEKRLYAPPI